MRMQRHRVFFAHALRLLQSESSPPFLSRLGFFRMLSTPEDNEESREALETSKREMLHELKIFSMISHPCIVEFFGAGGLMLFELFN